MNISTVNMKIQAGILRFPALAVLSGILLFLSFPDTNLSYLAWVAFIPMLMAVEDTGLPGSFMLGFITGFTVNAGTLYWIYPMISFNTGSWFQALLCLVSISSYMALYYGVWAAALRLVMRSSGDDATIDGRPETTLDSGKTTGSVERFRWKRLWYHVYASKAQFPLLRFSLLAAALWVSLEYLRSYLLTGFPWLLLGMSQWQNTSLIQICEFTGVYGISFMIIYANVGFARFFKTKKLASFTVVIAGLACVITLSYVIKLRNDISAPPYMSVAVLQGNIDQYKKWDSAYQAEIMKTYSELAVEASLHNPDLIVWPETAVPGYLPSNMYLYDWIREVTKETKTYNLIGSPYNNGDNEYFNGVLLFGPEGEMMGVHKKTHLVPFGEFVPFRKILEPYFGILNTLGDFTRGSDNNVFPVKSILCASTICSENFFGSTVRRFVLNGAEIIFNQTNDAWFFKTSAADQHFIMNVFRAVESRRTVVVAGNTGISGIISPGGAVKLRTKLFEKTYFIGKVTPSRYVTFYARYGDIFAQCCLAAAL